MRSCGITKENGRFAEIVREEFLGNYIKWKNVSLLFKEKFIKKFKESLSEIDDNYGNLEGAANNIFILDEIGTMINNSEIKEPEEKSFEKIFKNLEEKLYE